MADIKKTEKTSTQQMPMGPHRGPGGPGMIGGGEKAKDTKGTLKRIFTYIGNYKKQLALVFVMILLSTGANLGATYVMKPVIDELGSGNINRTTVLGFLALLGVLYLIYAVTQWAQSYILAGVSQYTVREMRRDLFDKMELLPVKFFDTNSKGDLMSRMTNDVDMVSQTLSNSIAQLFSGAISLIGTLAIMIYLSPLLTLASMITVPLMFLITRTIAKHTRKMYREQQDALGDLNGQIEESVTGEYAVKVFCRETEQKEKFNALSEKYYNKALWAQAVSGSMGPIMTMINNLSYGIVACIGGLLAVNPVLGMQALSVGTVVTFLNYSGQFARPLNEMANLFATIQSAIAGAERVFDIMDTPNEYIGDAEKPEMGQIRGDVVLKDVDFGYNEDRLILKNINLYANAGQMIALVGPTGAGKTTIVNLLTRFYDVNRGTITIDGTDICDVQKDSLRKKIAIVLQDTHMFSETVRENIRYGNIDASDEDVESAARLANAHDFITRLPNGYDTMLTDDASNISQGQRQLLSIARAMLADPEILILDEATSSVDTRTEIKIQQAMAQLMLGRTCFVIAHRLSTIRGADLIAVINGGEIVERGTHAELIEKGGMYAKLYNGQFSE